MNNDQRDPDAMLARLRSEEAASDDRAHPRGRLKIFFGFAAGVGKTYTMLEAARVAAIAGRELVLGYIEPHARPETEALLVGQELLPARPLEYRGVTLREFDLDAALQRKPDLMLVDELAHTNAPGSRHAKRWQDVQELLEAGIHVWTTLNVQHIESLNDIVAQITGIQVRETIPDRVFDEAAEVELVDIPPDELLDRFRAGKVYVPGQAERAAERFFRKANLVALREIAMRRLADRVGRDVQTARLGHARTQIWPTSERLLVCVGPSPTSAKVIRTAKRMAAAMHAEWMAVHAETPARQRLDERASAQLAANFKLAEGLGAETVTLTGENVADEIVRYAQSRNVTKIVIGKTPSTSWRRPWQRSIVDRLIACSGDTDIYIIRGVDEGAGTSSRFPRPRGRPLALLLAAGLLALATGVAAIFDALGQNDANLVMTYLLAVVATAVWAGRGAAVMASIAAVLLYNFFFTTPYYTFAVDDPQYLFTFAVMLVIALLVSAMTVRIRAQIELARERERRTEALYRVSHRLAATSGLLQLVASAEEELSAIFAGEVVIFLQYDGGLRPVRERGAGFTADHAERAAARWVFEHNQPAGWGTDTLPSTLALYLPLPSPDGCVGVLAFRPANPAKALGPAQHQLVEAFATQVALALERDRLTQEAQRVLAQAEAERLRSSLLSAVSHDLRTPLAAIVGSASSLLSEELAPDIRRELTANIHAEADRLSRLVENLLHMTRIESGALRVDAQLQPLEEVIGSALHRLRAMLEGREIVIRIDPNLPLVPLDGLLIEQVLVNLIENAAKYSPAGTPIEIGAQPAELGAEIHVADRGPGLDPAERELVFDRFYRSARTRSDRGRGAGLGLAICRAIVQAHRGQIGAEPRDGGGTSFRFTLPLTIAPESGKPPIIEPQEATRA